LSQEQ